MRIIKGIIAVVLFLLVEAYIVLAGILIYQKVSIRVWIFPEWFIIVLIVIASVVIVYFLCHLITKLLESVFGVSKSSK